MYYLGIDIGGTKCAAVLGTLDQNGYKILEKEKTATARRAPAAVLDELHSLSKKVTEKRGLSFKDISGIGISCGGPLDAIRGVILSPPNLPGWDEVRIADFFTAHTGCPAYLVNDADGCAAAEYRFGAGRGYKSMVFLTFGTGLGAGIVANGKLYSGEKGLAGEIGHVRLSPSGPYGYGKHGSAEGFCSGGGIADLAKRYVKKDPEGGQTLLARAGGSEGITAKLVAELARGGDRLCIKVYEKSGEMLGRVLAILMDILNPGAIVIGSIFARDGELLKKSMDRVIKKEALSPCAVLPAALSEDIGDVSALLCAAGGLENV